jgi:hypothetical protein
MARVYALLIEIAAAAFLPAADARSGFRLVKYQLQLE